MESLTQREMRVLREAGYHLSPLQENVRRNLMEEGGSVEEWKGDLPFKKDREEVEHAVQYLRKLGYE